jgi:hypothetical protein
MCKPDYLGCIHHTHTRVEQTLRDGLNSSKIGMSEIVVQSSLLADGFFSLSVACFFGCWESIALSPVLTVIAFSLPML